jgi:hypothetical protein
MLTEWCVCAVSRVQRQCRHHPEASARGDFPQHRRRHQPYLCLGQDLHGQVGRVLPLDCPGTVRGRGHARLHQRPHCRLQKTAADHSLPSLSACRRPVKRPKPAKTTTAGPSAPSTMSRTPSSLPSTRPSTVTAPTCGPTAPSCACPRPTAATRRSRSPANPSWALGEYADTVVPAPGSTAFGTTDQCGAYYQVQAADTCNRVSLADKVSVALFQAINPSIDADCANLVPGLWYCVHPTYDWNVTVSDGGGTTAPPATSTTSAPSCAQAYTV